MNGKHRRIVSASDFVPACIAAERSGDTEALGLLMKHHIHAYHCGGYEVLAWPCPAVAETVERLTSYKRKDDLT